MLLVLILLHLAAIVFYQVRKRNNLIGPMINGDKVLPDDVPASRDDTASRLGGVMVFAACAAVVATLLTLVGE